MSLGEAWVAHPIFPVLVVILAFWVGTFTIVLVRNWNRIQRLEQMIKTLTTKDTINDIEREIEHLSIKVNVIDDDVERLIQAYCSKRENEKFCITHT